jgi:EF-P beta-lysylation protein EpmB
MIPLQTSPWQGEHWSQQLSGAIGSVEALLKRVELTPQALDVEMEPGFPVRVPEAFLARIKPGDPNDPLLRQVLPLRAENQAYPGYVGDPLLEHDATLAPGVIQKYHGRALIIAAGACAVHCRYCFRRAFPYTEHRLGPEATSLAVIAADASITEVILSGGDPLMLKDTHLDRLVGRLEAIEHLTRLRIHTRLPVVIPARVTDLLVERLMASRLSATMVVHVNHPNEIDAELVSALARVADAGVQLLNQSVLLQGVNDDINTLVGLSEALFAARILPYYLHLPDKVTGTHHFSVSTERARGLYSQMQYRLPGYLVPRLAREMPGEGAKQWLAPANTSGDVSR